MDIVNTLIKILKEKHGKDLDLENDVYYLFLKGGLFSLYFDQDEKSIKVDVEFLPEENTFVYFSDEELEKLMS
mgnify:CR=1 FL=1